MDKKKTQVHTIDEKHNDMMEMYMVIEKETIPKLKTEIQTMIENAKRTKQKKNENYYEMIDNIKTKKHELRKLQNSKNEY